MTTFFFFAKSVRNSDVKQKYIQSGVSQPLRNNHPLQNQTDQILMFVLPLLSLTACPELVL